MSSFQLTRTLKVQLLLTRFPCLTTVQVRNRIFTRNSFRGAGCDGELKRWKWRRVPAAWANFRTNSATISVHPTLCRLCLRLSSFPSFSLSLHPFETTYNTEWPTLSFYLSVRFSSFVFFVFFFYPCLSASCILASFSASSFPHTACPLLSLSFISHSTLRCTLSFSAGFSLSLDLAAALIVLSRSPSLSLSFSRSGSLSIPPCPSFPCNLPQCVTTGPRATESQRDARARARPCLYSVLVAFLCRVQRVLIGAHCNINYGPRALRNFYPSRGCSHRRLGSVVSSTLCRLERRRACADAYVGLFGSDRWTRCPKPKRTANHTLGLDSWLLTWRTKRDVDRSPPRDGGTA